MQPVAAVPLESGDGGFRWARTETVGGVALSRRDSPDKAGLLTEFEEDQLIRRTLWERQGKGEIPTGLFYMNSEAVEMHDLNATPNEPLHLMPYAKLTPGAAA